MENLFAELLQMSLGTRGSLSRAPRDVEWNAFFIESQKQCVTSLMICGLERLTIDQKPPQTLLFEWIGVNQMTEAAYALQCERAKELTDIFKQQGYRSCVLKGIGTAQLYPVPARRQCGDIDIWVAPKVNGEGFLGEPSGKAERKVHGFRKELTKWVKTQCSVGHSEWHHLEAEFFKDVSVEVHFHPAWLYNPIHNRKLQRFFEQKKNDAMIKRPDGFNYPKPDFDVVFSLVHTFHHLLEEGVGLRHIVDYYYILKALPQEERRKSLEIIRGLGLEKFLSAMMWVLQKVCEMSSDYLLCTPNETEGKFLLNEIMAGGNFGKGRTDGLTRNSFSRYKVMVRHYPSEVLWMVPWKVWHKCWRMRYN